MKIILLISTLFFSLPVFAEKVLVANCTEGKGCTFELSDVDVELNNAGDLKVGKGETMVFGKTKDGKNVQYVVNKPRESIDRDWGGDGYTQIGLFNLQVQPRDGLWNVVYGDATGNDCYGIGNIGTFIRKQLGSGLAGSGDITFKFPFNPSKLFPSSNMRWVKTGYNSYKGLLDFASNKISGMKLHYNVTVVSPQRIETRYTVEIKVPTKETCRGYVPVVYTLIKAKELEDGLDFEPEDDLLPVNPKKDDLLPVNPKEDDLLPVEPGKKPKPNVPRLEDKPNVPRIEDKPKPNVPRIEDKPKPNVPRLEN